MGETGDPRIATENDDEAEAAIEHGRRLFAGRCDFVAGIASIDALPPPGRPKSPSRAGPMSASRP